MFISWIERNARWVFSPPINHFKGKERTKCFMAMTGNILLIEIVYELVTVFFFFYKK